MTSADETSAALSRIIKRYRWYRNRLAAMSASEVAHRIDEMRKRQISKRHVPGSVLDFDPGDMSLPVWPGLAEGVGRLAADPTLMSHWAKHRDAVAECRFEFLGITWPAPGRDGAMPDWHLDPVTGDRWPAGDYCFDIPYRHADAFGDVKNVWEISRLQYLQPLAAYARISEDPAATRLCLDHLLSWIDENPPYQGVNWPSMIEVAFRIVSIIVVTSLLGDHVSRDERIIILRSLYQHGWWIDRFPSRHSSANNHLVAEAAALFLLGSLSPDLPGASRWRSYGTRTLERAATDQIAPDGVGREQSPAYAALTLEWLLLCGDLGRRLDRPFSQSFWHRIGKAGEFLKWITDSGGHQPRIGDDDDSHVFGNGMGIEPTVNSVMGCIASATDEPALAPPVPVSHLRNALFPAPQPDVIWPAGVRHFGEGGYTVDRQPARDGTADHLLVFDHGALGYLSIAAHGHADTLAVWMHVGGRPVLIDGGTYLYHAGHQWRDHFRGTVAHNTLTISGENSSEISGPFNWARKAKASVAGFTPEADSWTISAEHDGYLESHRVTHRRTVARQSPNTFRIADRLLGPRGDHRVEIGFLVSPDFQVEAMGTGFVIRDEAHKTVLQILNDGQLPGWVETGRTAPERGWYSPSFGVRQAAPRIVFAGQLATNHETAFRLVVGDR
ncbi:heparinase II/III domain-containing protein [Minwuia sp.]|uniref:heparinase II/III domain-containing protein n=1 Tax=Minwuia sp. TaxID=2493630 RepID=UPI003A8D565C